MSEVYTCRAEVYTSSQADTSRRAPASSQARGGDPA